MDIGAKIYVAGHRGMVGAAIVRRLQAEGADNLVLRSRQELDLTRQTDVEAFFAAERPEYVFLAAAKVGGIHANSTYPAEFISENLAIQNHIIHNSYANGCRKLLFLGSSCIYPRDCAQPIKEEYLLTGPLEKSNEAYAVAKIAGIQMCQAYRKQYGFDAICAMPTNLYGPGDNFDLETSHVLPALIRKIYDAKQVGAETVEIWGTGNPLREFLHVDDLADAAVFLINRYSNPEIVNVGTGRDLTIRQLAERIADIIGYSGTLVFNPGKPDGTPRKLLDSSRIHMHGWTPRITLEAGIVSTVKAYAESCDGLGPRNWADGEK
jgi:GDP-L-fucose synthase